MSAPPPSPAPSGFDAGLDASPLAELRGLYDATASRLTGVCVRLLGDAGEAEEVVVEAYAAAARRTIPADGFAWLCAVARGRAIARLRARGPAPAEPDPVEEVIPASPSEGLRHLQAAMRELTPLQATSIKAAYLDGGDYPALARRAAVPLGALKSGMRRGLTRLQERLDAGVAEAPDGRNDAILAAELALGVLDAETRAKSEARAATDDAFAAAAAAWARELQPLNETVAPVMPPPGLWMRIAEIAEASPPRPPIMPPTGEAPAVPAAAPTVLTEAVIAPAYRVAAPRPRSLAVWRAAAFSAFALAAAAFVAAGVERAHKAALTPLLATKLMPAGGAPALLSPEPLFAATLDRSRRIVVLTAFGPGPVDPRDRELWLRAKGGKAVALGVIGRADSQALHVPTDALKAAEAGATLSVSLEPSGGWTTSRSPGPVIAVGSLGRV